MLAISVDIDINMGHSKRIIGMVKVKMRFRHINAFIEKKEQTVSASTSEKLLLIPQRFRATFVRDAATLSPVRADLEQVEKTSVQ